MSNEKQGAVIPFEDTPTIQGIIKSELSTQHKAEAIYKHADKAMGMSANGRQIRRYPPAISVIEKILLDRESNS